MQTEVLVIGAGVSGLTAAALLGVNGRDVTVVEQAPHPAPLMRRYQRDGFWCDAGLHYIGGLAGPDGLRLVWKLLGLKGDWPLQAMDADAFDNIQIGDGEPAAIPQGFDRVGDALAAQFPESATAIQHYIQQVESDYCEAPFIGRKTRPDWFRPDEASLVDHLLNLGAKNDLIKVLTAHGTMLHGVRPELTPLYLHNLVVGSFYQSAHIFHRGGDDIADDLTTAAERHGVRVLCSTRAMQMEFGDYRDLRGVQISYGNGESELIECGEIISTIHPSRLLAMMPEGLIRRGRRRRLTEGPDTYSAVMAHFALDEIPENLRGKNHYFTRPADGSNLNGGAILGVGPDQNDTAVSVLLKAWENDPGIADDSDDREICRMVIEAGGASHLKPEAQSRYDAYKERMGQEAKDELVARFPALAGKCSLLEVATPATFARWTGVPNGALYGKAHTTIERNPAYRGPIAHMQQAGQAIGLPGIVGVAISGAVAAGNLIGWDNIWAQAREIQEQQA